VREEKVVPCFFYHLMSEEDGGIGEESGVNRADDWERQSFPGRFGNQEIGGSIP
jgi:hypothetical protein